MRAALAAVFLFAAAVLPPGAAAQDDHPPASGCALPKINDMARAVFGAYAAVYHTGGSTPGAQSSDGKVRIFTQGMVSCMFFRTAPPPSEALFVILHSYANSSDAAKAFAAGNRLGTSAHTTGAVQFIDSPGKTLAYDNDRLLAEVRWASRDGSSNKNIPGTRLEAIAVQALIPK